MRKKYLAMNNDNRHYKRVNYYNYRGNKNSSPLNSSLLHFNRGNNYYDQKPVRIIAVMEVIISLEST